MPGSSGTASPILGTPTSNFKGEPIKHPAGYEVKIDTPLDWAGITDHSEYVGVIKFANDPKSPVSKQPAAQPLIMRPDKPRAEEIQRIFVYGVKVLMGEPPVKSLASPANNMNMRRNIFFKDGAKVPPMPFSALHSPFSEELW